VPEADTAANKRRYPRFTLSLPGRFMRSDKLDYPCRLIDISVESAAMTTPVPLRVGEKLIVYLSHLGGLEGQVIRLFPGGFAMAIAGTQRKRDKLAAQIPRLAAQAEIPQEEARTYPRVEPQEEAMLILDDGGILACRVHNLSLSGAALLTPARPELGSLVTLNKRRATVVRHYERGIAVEFLNDQHELSDASHADPLGAVER
jgi:hypothetical protein